MDLHNFFIRLTFVKHMIVETRPVHLRVEMIVIYCLHRLPLLLIFIIPSPFLSHSFFSTNPPITTCLSIWFFQSFICLSVSLHYLTTWMRWLSRDWGVPSSTTFVASGRLSNDICWYVAAGHWPAAMPSITEGQTLYGANKGIDVNL